MLKNDQTKHTFKILRCEHHKILKCVWPFFNIMYERFNNMCAYFFLLELVNGKRIGNNNLQYRRH